MAYARQRGNQVLIVHGERDPDTRKVQQRTLLTLYSKPEARAALAADDPSGRRLEALMRLAHPEVGLDWKRLRKEIRELLTILPDEHDYGEERLRSRFRDGLRAFTRQLALADPQHLLSSARLIQEHRHELSWLADFIRWRVELCEQAESQWNGDDAFHWRFTIRGREVPSDVEGRVAALWEKGDLQQATLVIRLLGECFPEDPELHNYLGLIALEQRRLDEAAGEFQKAIELGRRMFPKRIPKDDYWRNDRTRPYMRGLRNLSLTFLRAARWDEALGVCERLERECGDRITAMSHRAAIFVNTERWPEAVGAALFVRGLDPSEDLVAGLALFEVGRRKDAITSFLHGALNYPRAARLLLGRSSPAAPKHWEEGEDHNVGVSLVRNLHVYLKAPTRAGLSFFRRLVAEPQVSALLCEIEEVKRRWANERGEGRDAFDRMTVMQSLELAVERACEIAKALGVPEDAPAPVPLRRRRGSRPRVH